MAHGRQEIPVGEKQEELSRGWTFKDLLNPTRRGCSSVYDLQHPHVAELSCTHKTLFYNTVKVLPVYNTMLDGDGDGNRVQKLSGGRRAALEE